MTVRHFIEQLMVDQSLECHLIQCNLYQIFLKICNEKRITSGAPAMEEKKERITCCSRYSVLQITRLLWNRYNTDHITRGCADAHWNRRSISIYENPFIIGSITASVFGYTDTGILSGEI